MKPADQPQQRGQPPSGAGPDPGYAPGLWRYAVVITIAAMLGLYWVTTSTPEAAQLTYTEFKEDVRGGRVTEVVFRGQEIRGRRRVGEAAGAETERERLGVMLAGRCAERIVFGETSSGAEQDLKQATQIARRMITQWGMSPRLGPVAFHRGEEHVFLGHEMTQARDWSEGTAELIDNELRELLSEIDEEVDGLLKHNRAALDRLVDELLDHETVDGERIRQIVEGRGAARAARRSA